MPRVSTASGLAVRKWPGENNAVVFSADTVSTHLVSEVAAAVLELASSRSVTTLEATSLLAAADQPVDSTASDISEDLRLMEETITGLVAAGLLRHVE